MSVSGRLAFRKRITYPSLRCAPPYPSCQLPSWSVWPWQLKAMQPRDRRNNMRMFSKRKHHLLNSGQIIATFVYKFAFYGFGKKSCWSGSETNHLNSGLGIIYSNLPRFIAICFTPTWGNEPIWLLSYFSIGLKQPRYITEWHQWRCLQKIFLLRFFPVSMVCRHISGSQKNRGS